MQEIYYLVWPCNLDYGEQTWYVVLQPIHKYNKTSNFDVMVQWCCTNSSLNNNSLSIEKRTDNSCNCSTCGESTPKIHRRSQWGSDRKKYRETDEGTQILFNLSCFTELSFLTLQKTTFEVECIADVQWQSGFGTR